MSPTTAPPRTKGGNDTLDYRLFQGYYAKITPDWPTYKYPQQHIFNNFLKTY